MWDIANIKINVGSSLLQKTLTGNVKKNTCPKRHRKTCKHRESCKYKVKCAFRHDEKTDADVSNQIPAIKKSIK